MSVYLFPSLEVVARQPCELEALWSLTNLPVKAVTFSNMEAMGGDWSFLAGSFPHSHGEKEGTFRDITLLFQVKSDRLQAQPSSSLISSWPSTMTAAANAREAMSGGKCRQRLYIY